MQPTAHLRASCLGLLSLLSFYPFSTVFAQRNTPVRQGLLTRYSFDNSLADSLRARNDLVGTVTYGQDRRGISNGALICNGTTQASASFSLSLARDFSTACWVKPDFVPAQNQLQSICTIEAGLTLYFSLGLSGDSGIGFRFESGGSSQPFVNYKPGIDYSGAWMHIAVVRANSIIRLYVNGVERDTALTNSALLDGLSNPFTIGGSTLIQNFGFGGFYNGLLDEFRIYNRPLTKAEVDTLSENLNTSTKFHNSKTSTTQVWDKSLFWEAHPSAKLFGTDGRPVAPNQSPTGIYLWTEGMSKRRVILL